MPRGLIPQFQVLSHRHAGPHPERWRAGCTLTIHDCPVLVDGKPGENVVDILVAGPEHQQRDALAVVRDLFQQVHDRMPETVPVARVPLSDAPDVDVGYDHLRKLEARFGPRHRFVPEGADRQYAVADLLSGVRRSSRDGHQDREPAGLTPTGDVTIVNRIEAPSLAPTQATPRPGGNGDGAEDLSRWADGAGIGAMAGFPVGAAGAALYILGQADGWPFELLLGGGAIGAAGGAVVGALTLGRRRTR